MPPDISLGNSGFDRVKLGQVSTQHDLNTSDKINPLCDVLNSDDLFHSAHLFDVQVLDHIIVDMDSDAYRSFADEEIIEDTKQKVMAIMEQIPNTLAKPQITY